MEIDTCVSLKPYFTIHEGKVEEFKKIWKDSYDLTEPGMLYYGFSFKGNKAHCREGYRDAKAVNEHLDNVGKALEEALKIADLDRLEVHGPKDQIDILKKDLAHLEIEYYVLEWGFRMGV